MSKVLEYLTEETGEALDFIIEMISSGCNVSKDQTELVFNELFDAGIIDMESVKWWISELNSDEDFE